MSKYQNGRMILRGAGGRFRRERMQDLGIGGVCKKCLHFLMQHYDGDPCPDPRKFRLRCFTCEPMTEAEQALATPSKRTSIYDVLKASA